MYPHPPANSKKKPTRQTLHQKFPGCGKSVKQADKTHSNILKIKNKALERKDTLSPIEGTSMRTRSSSKNGAPGSSSSAERRESFSCYTPLPAIGSKTKNEKRQVKQQSKKSVKRSLPKSAEKQHPTQNHQNDDGLSDTIKRMRLGMDFSLLDEDNKPEIQNKKNNDFVSIDQSAELHYFDINLIIRLPNGMKKHTVLKSNDSLQAVIKFLSTEMKVNVNLKKYVLYLNEVPKKELICSNSSLIELGIHDRKLNKIEEPLTLVLLNEMSNAKETKVAYLEAALQKQQEINNELLFMISQHEENVDEQKFTVRLHGNKRNERNEMYRKRIDDKEVEVLYMTLKPNTYINGIDLGYNAIGDEGAATLGKLLEETHALEVLILSYNDIGVHGVTAIARGLQMNDTLVTLKLDGNKVKRIGGLALAGALQVNTTLEELNINNTEQDIQSLIAISTVLKANSSLKVLDVGRPILNTEQEETTIHFAKMLEVNRRLNEIHLGKHSMTNFGAEQLINHIMDNFSLLKLDLSCNRISRDGAQHIAKFLKQNPPLKLLHLGYNRVEDDGAIHLADSLASGNMTLETLVLVSNSLTGKGLCALAKCLPLNSSLRQLFVWGNQLDTPACQAFLNLTSGEFPRLLPDDTDVRAYVVDDVPYLSRVTSIY